MTGDGGDESFAGYDRFAGQRLVDLYCMLPGWLRRQVFGRLVDRLPDSFGYKSFAQKARWLHALSGYSAGERYVQSLSYLRFTEEAKARLFTDEAAARVTEPGSAQGALRHFEADGVNELVDRMLYTDLMTRMPDHLLSTVDRMSMAHSLETRAPLVDPCVVEFAAALPVHLKLHGRQLKYILRRIARRYLPADLVDRPKQGFSFPIARWLKGELAPLLLNLFADSRFVALGLFRREEVDRLIAEHIGGRADHNYRLWLLVNLEIWHRHHLEGRSVGQLEEDIRGWMGRPSTPAAAVA
jgi:asparagine synthase (glutamine-hydrolysing)